MSQVLHSSAVAAEQRAAMRVALQSAHLPADDLNAEGVALFAFDLDGQTIGYGGFEAYEQNALLRSLVVAATHRRRGYGREIVQGVLREARRAGATNVYLLTLDAKAHTKGRTLRLFSPHRPPGKRDARPRSCAERAKVTPSGQRYYFERLGFAAVERARAPASILATRQAAGRCPASAALIVRALPK